MELIKRTTTTMTMKTMIGSNNKMRAIKSNNSVIILLKREITIGSAFRYPENYCLINKPFFFSLSLLSLLVVLKTLKLDDEKSL